MRLFGGLFGAIYVVIGIVIANTHHYLSSGGVRGVVSAVRAVLLWRRVEFVEADLGRPLPIDRPVDAVFSTATFHWIDDHDALFRNLAAVLRPGGRLVAQCGGAGNLASVWDAVRAVDPTRSTTKRFEGPDDTARRLEAAGFVEVLAWLTDAPTPFEPGEPLKTFLA